jgi:hypothetical protein
MDTFYGHRYGLLAPAVWPAQKLCNKENRAPIFSHDYLEDLEIDEWPLHQI